MFYEGDSVITMAISCFPFKGDIRGTFVHSYFNIFLTFRLLPFSLNFGL